MSSARRLSTPLLSDIDACRRALPRQGNPGLRTYVTFDIRMLELSQASNNDAEVAGRLVQTQRPPIDAMEMLR